MTKLPKGLEKLIEQKADSTRVYGALLSPHEQDIWIDGGTDIALEVLQRAEKLAEALKSIKCDNKELGTAEECIDALSNWQAWKESK